MRTAGWTVRERTSLASVESALIGIAGKSAIVTGAAGGIGRATVELLSGLGANVLAVDQAAAVPAWTGNGPGRIVPFQADVADEARAEEAVRNAVAEFGGLDILVNNAGMLRGGSLLEMKREDTHRIMDVNLGGYLNYSRAASAWMVKSGKGGGGRIVNVSSLNAFLAESGIVAYAASKGAILMLTRCTAVELAPYGIRVNSVAPGWVDTPMGTGFLDRESRKIVEGRIPLGYIAPPAEIARTIVFLASDLSRYMTGHIMMVDGGISVDASIPGLQY
jgi:NAD(P)-dependent dehydrogenase (short-subunit alcohol dehydrogenase family)